MHAFLMTAYQDPEGLAGLVDDLGPAALVFIHYDRKARLSSTDEARLRRSPTVVHFSRRYKVNWGGHAHLKAILHLIRTALEERSVQRLHLITGSDRPIVPPARFKAFFEQRPASEFIQYFPLPTPYWKGGGIDRLTLYHPLDLFNAKDPIQKKLLDLTIHIQRRLGISRSMNGMPPLFGGSTYWSLTRDCLSYVMHRCDERPEFLHRLRFTHVPEEIFFQSLIMDSPFADNVVNDNLRYVDWNKRNGSTPAILDLTDLDRILASGKLFARKLQGPISKGLLNALRGTKDLT